MPEPIQTRLEHIADAHARHPNMNDAQVVMTLSELLVYADCIAFTRKHGGIRRQHRLKQIEN